MGYAIYFKVKKEAEPFVRKMPELFLKSTCILEFVPPNKPLVGFLKPRFNEIDEIVFEELSVIAKAGYLLAITDDSDSAEERIEKLTSLFQRHFPELIKYIRFFPREFLEFSSIQERDQLIRNLMCQGYIDPEAAEWKEFDLQYPGVLSISI